MLASIDMKSDALPLPAPDATGDELLTVLRSSAVDVVVLDLSLGERSGLDLLKHIKSEFPRLPVVIAPGTVLIGQDERAWQAVTGVFLDWVERNHIAIVNLTPDYADYSANDVYFDGIHLRPLGNRIVAKAIEAQFASSL